MEVVLHDDITLVLKNVSVQSGTDYSILIGCDVVNGDAFLNKSPDAIV
jgi:uncharacterized protein (DUF302 family)